MEKVKKLGIAVCTFILLLGGLYVYWEREIPLMSLLPDEDWTKVQLLMGNVGSDEWEREFTDPPLDRILDFIQATKVTRDEKDPYLDDQYFQIYLIPEDGYPTVIHVEKNGEVIVFADSTLDMDEYRYYEDGEILYSMLLSLSGELSARFIITQ